MAKPLRGRDGQFARNPDTAARDAEACRLRVRGLGYDAIAKELGYVDQAHAFQAVKRALDATVAEPAEDVRKYELKRLDAMWEQALEIAKRFHVTVQQGRVVYLGERPIKDDAPALAAIDRLLKIQERRARYLGLDAPVKSEVRHVDAVDAEIERLVAQLAGRGQEAPPTEAPAAHDAGHVRHPG